MPKYSAKERDRFFASLADILSQHAGDSPIQREWRMIQQLIGESDSGDEADPEFLPEIGAYAVALSAYTGNDGFCRMEFYVLAEDSLAESAGLIDMFFADLTKHGYKLIKDESTDEDKGVLVFVVGKK